MTHEQMIKLMDEQLFELIGPNGETWKLYADGRVEGFPPETTMVNYAMPILNALIGEIIRKDRAVPA